MRSTAGSGDPDCGVKPVQSGENWGVYWILLILLATGGKRHTVCVQQRLCSPCSVSKLKIFHLAVFLPVDVRQEPCLSSEGTDDN